MSLLLEKYKWIQTWPNLQFVWLYKPLALRSVSFMHFFANPYFICYIFFHIRNWKCAFILLMRIILANTLITFNNNILSQVTKTCFTVSFSLHTAVIHNIVLISLPTTVSNPFRNVFSLNPSLFLLKQQPAEPSFWLNNPYAPTMNSYSVILIQNLNQTSLICIYIHTAKHICMSTKWIMQSTLVKASAFVLFCSTHLCRFLFYFMHLP